MLHKYRVGQTVQLMQGARYVAISSIGYQIIGQLPEMNGEFSYRIKSARETHHRVVKQSQLIKG
jgi:hypothetical protein